jgi:hypothetical protein
MTGLNVFYWILYTIEKQLNLCHVHAGVCDIKKHLNFSNCTNSARNKIQLACGPWKGLGK